MATGEVPVDAPVSAVMTSGAFTVAPDRLAGDVLLDLLDRGVRHAPVVDGAGTVLGVLDDLDLLATEARLPFRLRRAAADAPSPEAVADAARQLPGAVVALFDAGLAPTQISAVATTVLDAVTRRLFDLAVDASRTGARAGLVAGPRQPRPPRGRAVVGRRHRARVARRRRRPADARVGR